ncbi:MAG: hypothetical protein CVU06_13120 [Bacteroidetes bacterium HGW-Bacteroidetes-22]|nr:MAG: hypothetical protein CVU06_13120 [Bacteroidetes bacterium HGW-Bacteroidetes-22]
MDIAPGKFSLRSDNIRNINNGDSTTYQSNFKEVDHNFGKGARFGFTLGTRITKAIPGLCFQISVFKKFKSTIAYESYKNETYEYYMNFFINQTTIEQSTGSALFINPALVIRSETGKIKPYMKLGALLMFSTFESDITLNGSTNITNYYPTFGAYQKFEFETDPSLGVDFGLGTTLTLTDGLSAFGEIDFQYIKTWPTKRTMVEYTEQGSDKLSSLTVSERETEFTDEYSTNWNDNPNQPSKDLKSSVTFNSLSINAGIIYNF